MKTIISFLFLIILLSLKNSSKTEAPLSCNDFSEKTVYNKGEYGYDLEFLKKYLNPVELVNNDSRLIIEPEYQGRVMTSTSSGLKGFSYGWMNYSLISSSVHQEHFNPYGGEERIWLGPEGGQFSLFFKKDTTFSLENWFVPAVLDKEPFNVANRDKGSVTLNKSFKLENFSGTVFKIEITRKVTLLTRSEIIKSLGKIIDKSVHVVAYKSENRLKNTGTNIWNKESGALSIWMLSMLNPSTDVTVVLPFRVGDRGRIVSEYFGKIPENRLKVSENAVFFLADGKFRSKIGITPQRAVPVIGSYDAKNKVLTLIEYSLPETAGEYVNSALEIQKEPFKGDVINSYNDGPTANGSQLGPFYELEISSPAALLKPGDEIIHVQKIYHLEGSEKTLDIIAKSLLHVSLSEIRNIFRN
jgi:hypothetical protein